MSSAAEFTLSLICAPGAPALDSEASDAAAAALRSAGVERGERRMLAEAVAEDHLFAAALDGDGRDALRAAVTGALGDRPIDVNVMPAAGRAKQLLIADMDSTIIQQECLDELADFAGVKDQIAAVTERTMRGELEFESALRERVSLLKGLSASALQETLDRRVTLTPGARTLVATMRARGAATALVSGGFTFFTERIAAQAGFASHRANTLTIEDGALAGRVEEPILGRAAKETALMELCAEHGIEPSDALAVGDGANDLAMIGAAGLGVAFRAKPLVASAADARIDHGDLTALLYLQGVARADFVET